MMEREDFKTDEEFEIYMGDNELSTCDKCGHVESTYDLIWITAEDFEPLKRDYQMGYTDEKLKEMAKTHDALCEGCYLELIK